MKHICAWCGCETAPPDGNGDDLTTHGVCKKCFAVIMAEFDGDGKVKRGQHTGSEG